MVNWRDWHSSCQETRFTPTLQENSETSFADKVLYMDLYCWGKDSSVTPTGFCLGLVDYIASEDAWAISVKPS